MSIIDLNTLSRDHKFKLAVEPGETRGERCVRLFKDVALFLVAIVLVGLVMWVCIDTLLYAEGVREDEKKWAMSVLSSAVGGILGYLIRSRA